MLDRIEDAVFDRLRDSPLAPAVPDEEGRFPLATAAAIAVGAVVVVGVMGFLAPGPQNDPAAARWYRNLDKPRATPPGPVFGLAWTAIELGLGYAAFRLLLKPSDVWRNRALGVLAVNLTTIPTFAKLFFGKRDLKAAEANTVAQFFGAWSFVAAAWNADRQAAMAGLPHAIWVSFANWLMAEILHRNDPSARRLARRASNAVADATPTPDAAR